jgi:hypothetical protein
MSVNFTPGAFEPVIQTTLQPGQPPVGVHVEYDGFLDLVEDAFLLGRNASSGRGGNADFDVPMTKQASKAVGHLLAARSICEQYQAVEKKMPKVANALTKPPCELPEPIAKAFNYFGHFEVDNKLYATFDLEQKLTYHVVCMSKYATEGLANLDSDKYEPTEDTQVKNVQYSRFGINAAGEFCAKARTTLDVFLTNLCKNILAASHESLSLPEKLQLIEVTSKIGTEYALTPHVNYLKSKGVKIPDRTLNGDPSEAHTKALKAIFGTEEFPTQVGAVLKTSVVLSKITLAYRILNLLVDTIRPAMKTIRLGKYEGGSRAQLAFVDKDTGLTSSSVPLSLADLTFAAACLPGIAPSRMYVGTIMDDPRLVRETLIRQAIRT